MNLRFGLRFCALLSSVLFVLLTATPSPAVAGPGGGVGARCGGFVGQRCAPGLWCEMRPGACRVADAFGRCVARPQICTRIFQPVCGCNGRTYGNDCERRAAMVNKRHNGPCKRHYR